MAALLISVMLLYSVLYATAAFIDRSNVDPIEPFTPFVKWLWVVILVFEVIHLINHHLTPIAPLPLITDSYHPNCLGENTLIYFLEIMPLHKVTRCHLSPIPAPNARCPPLVIVDLPMKVIAWVCVIVAFTTTWNCANWEGCQAPSASATKCTEEVNLSSTMRLQLLLTYRLCRCPRVSAPALIGALSVRHIPFHPI